jgi:hypothetical protein
VVTDLDTLLDRIEAGRTALADAIAAAATRWEEALLVAEDPAAAAWSPRDAVEHCLSGEQMYVQLIDETLSAEAPPSFLDFVTALDWNWSIRSFDAVELADAPAATVLLRAQGEAVSTRLRALTAAHLARPTTLLDAHLDALEAAALPAEHSVAGILGVMALHYEAHAAQLAEAVGG